MSPKRVYILDWPTSDTRGQVADQHYYYIKQDLNITHITCGCLSITTSCSSSDSSPLPSSSSISGSWFIKLPGLQQINSRMDMNQQNWQIYRHMNPDNFELTSYVRCPGMELFSPFSSKHLTILKYALFIYFHFLKFQFWLVHKSLNPKWKINTLESHYLELAYLELPAILNA